jgi:hypothetical protein
VRKTFVVQNQIDLQLFRLEKECLGDFIEFSQFSHGFFHIVCSLAQCGEESNVISINFPEFLMNPFMH